MKTLWLIILLATLSWYAFVTFQVLRKGWRDIRQLMRELTNDLSNS